MAPLCLCRHGTAFIAPLVPWLYHATSALLLRAWWQQSLHLDLSQTQSTAHFLTLAEREREIALVHGKISMCHPGLPLQRGQSSARITIGLAGLVICDLSPTMTCQWASVSSGLWCSSDLVLTLCPLSRAVLPGQPSRATFAGAPFAIHRLWAMSSIVCLIALISVTSGPNFLACSKMLRGACVCSCGTGTRSLSAIVSLPCCRRLRHEHNPVLISQAG